MPPGSLIWIALGSGLLAFVTATANKVLSELSWHELGEYCRLRKLPGRFDEIHDRADSVRLTTETLQVIGTITSILACASTLR